MILEVMSKPAAKSRGHRPDERSPHRWESTAHTGPPAAESGPARERSARRSTAVDTVATCARLGGGSNGDCGGPGSWAQCPGAPTARHGGLAGPPLGHQPAWAACGASRFAQPPDGDRSARPVEERDFLRGRRVQVGSQRSARAPRGLADLGPPFVAGMKRPSATHASQRSFCWSLSWAKKARQRVSNTPIASHCFRRHQQVRGLPSRRGSSRHGAPVQRLQRMPSTHRRSATRGRPPRGEALAWGSRRFMA